MTACAMGFKVNLALPRVTRVDLFHPIGASVDCGLLARSEKRRDVFDLIVGDLRKRRHTGTSGVDDRPDLFAVFIAQSDGGANKVGAFPARRIGAMTEAAGGNEQVFSALHCRRMGTGRLMRNVFPRGAGVCAHKPKANITGRTIRNMSIFPYRGYRSGRDMLSIG